MTGEQRLAAYQAAVDFKFDHTVEGTPAWHAADRSEPTMTERPTCSPASFAVQVAAVLLAWEEDIPSRRHNLALIMPDLARALDQLSAATKG